MVAVAAAWGSCFLLLDWGSRGGPLLWFVAWRALIAGLALLGLMLVSRRKATPNPPLTPTMWGLIGALAVLNVTLAFAAMAASTATVTTGVASLLANAQALLVVLPAWWLFGERPRAVEIAAVAIGFGGLMLVTLPHGGVSGGWLGLLASAGIAAGALLGRRLDDMDVLALGAWQFLIGGALLTIVAAIAEGPPVAGWSIGFVFAVLVLALIGTTLPYVLWFAELRRASITAVTLWTLLVPVIGLALSVVVLGESLTLADAVGNAIVVVALILIANSGRHRST